MTETERITHEVIDRHIAKARREEIRYISCQTCHKPAGDHHTIDTGTCYDCERAIIAAGHQREAEKDELHYNRGIGTGAVHHRLP